MSAFRAGTKVGEGPRPGRYCLGAVAWGDMALWCYCRDRVLCSRVHCDGEVLDSDQEGPVRSREKGQQRRECVRWDSQSAVVRRVFGFGAFSPVAGLLYMQYVLANKVPTDCLKVNLRC